MRLYFADNIQNKEVFKRIVIYIWPNNLTPMKLSNSYIQKYVKWLVKSYLTTLL